LAIDPLGRGGGIAMSERSSGEQAAAVEEIFDMGEYALSDTEKVALGIDPLEPPVIVDDEPEPEPEPEDTEPD
jgi:hypothetical protein